MMNLRHPANAALEHTGSTAQKQIQSNSLAEFKSSGGTIREWAVERGFNPRLVYSVARGERKCLRGKSFEIAKELGMK